MAMLVVSLFSLIEGSVAAHAAVSLRSGRNYHNGGSEGEAATQGSFIKAFEFKHRLRVCNAYAYSGAMDVFKASEKLTTTGPMRYKACQDFNAALKPGDKLEFKVGDASTGTFSVSDMPNNDAVLLLVVHRHDRLSTAVSFESHVFASLQNAQVAVIDTYQGSAAATPSIKDEASSKNTRSEELRYNSVVAVNPGKYDVVLDTKDGKQMAKGRLVARNLESYVVLRTGVEAEQGESFPEELIIFPQTDPAEVHSGAAAGAAPYLSALLLLVGVLLA
jgi:hypothetical protein